MNKLEHIFFGLLAFLMVLGLVIIVPQAFSGLFMVAVFVAVFYTILVSLFGYDPEGIEE